MSRSQIKLKFCERLPKNTVKIFSFLKKVQILTIKGLKMVRKCNGGNPYLQARRNGVGAYTPPPLDTENIFSRFIHQEIDCI